MVLFETVVIGANGVERSNDIYGAINGVDGIVFKGINGTNYGPYGGSAGTYWEADIPSGGEFVKKQQCKKATRVQI